MARIHWAALLGLQGLAARWRTRAAEGASAVEDRLALARLEWAGHKHQLARLALVLVLLGALLLVALLMLSAAVLVQFWDTPQRVLVAWCVALAWCLACVATLGVLLSLMRQTRQMFALTRRELAEDWRAIKERL